MRATRIPQSIQHLYGQRFSRVARVAVKLWLLVLVLQGCTDSKVESKSVEDTHNRMQVLVLLPQDPDVDAWSAQGLAGASRIQEQVNAQVQWLVNTDPNKNTREKIFTQMKPSLDAGVNLIIGVGAQYEDILRLLASEYPYVRMAVVGEVAGNQRNFGAISGRFDDLGYVLGTVAYQYLATTAPVNSVVGQTNVSVGFLGGIPFLAYQKMGQAFENAVLSHEQNIDILVDWVGSFSAPDQAYLKAKSLLDQGVQVLLVNTGMGNSVIATLIKDYPDRRLLLIDTDERTHWNPEQIMATGIIDIAELMSNSAKQVSAGHWYGQQEWFGFKANVAQVKLNAQLVSVAQKQNIEQVIDQLNQGLVVPTMSSKVADE